MVSKEFIYATDLFDIRCKKCGSIGVDFWIEACEECNNHVNFECDNCDNKFEYHKFEQMTKEELAQKLTGKKG